MKLSLLLLALIFTVTAHAQQTVIPLYSGVAPGSEGWTQKEVEYLDGAKRRMIRNVVSPTLTAFFPEKGSATGAAIIVCPGGGFYFHSWDNEGVEVAKWLAARGVTAFVLKYRTLDSGATDEEFQMSLKVLFGQAKSRAREGDSAAIERETTARRIIPSLAIADGRQSVKIVRERAGEFGIDPRKIGIMGFSAGAAVTMGVVMDNAPESKPNFAAPIYGGSTGSRPVPENAPPLFVLVASDDEGPATGSIRLYNEWKQAKKSVELHIYAKGGHGFGMAKRGLPIDNWIERLGDWLGAQGLLKKGTAR